MKTEIPSVGSDSLMADLLEEKHIGYKVVRWENSRSFRPATDSALQSFRYRLNRETRRDKSTSGPIALFVDSELAKEFAKRHGTHILLVEYVPSEVSKLWKKNPLSFTRSHGSYYAVSNGVSEMLDGFPPGTIFAESVYPLEVVS